MRNGRHAALRPKPESPTRSEVFPSDREYLDALVAAYPALAGSGVSLEDWVLTNVAAVEAVREELQTRG